MLRSLLVSMMLVCVLSLVALAPDRAQAQSIHDVVSETWPAPLVPTAEQIAYHEGGGVVTDGYCGWGIIPSTQAYYGSVYGLDAYECSAYAYRIYLNHGWSAWTTYGWYTPGAEYTPVTY